MVLLLELPKGRILNETFKTFPGAHIHTIEMLIYYYIPSSTTRQVSFPLHPPTFFTSFSKTSTTVVTSINRWSWESELREATLTGSKRYNKYAKHSPSQSRDIRQQAERPNTQFPTPLSYPLRRNFDQNGIICFDAGNKRCTLWCARWVRFSLRSHRLTLDIGVLPWNVQ